MKSFLQTAQELCHGASLAEDAAPRFRRVLDYRNRHDFLEQNVGLDLTNLEDLFGLVDLNLRVDPPVSHLRRDPLFLILQPLEQTVRKETPKRAKSNGDPTQERHE